MNVDIGPNIFFDTPTNHTNQLQILNDDLTSPNYTTQLQIPYDGHTMTNHENNVSNRTKS